MKTRLLIILIIVCAITIVLPAHASCGASSDWPERPCYDAGDVSLEEKQNDWSFYYDYKGESWMEQKKYEMEQAMQTNSLSEWIELTNDTDAHYNVHFYYYLLGQAPNSDGEYIFVCNMYEDVLRYEEILKDDLVLQFFLEKFPLAVSSLGGIDESRPPQTSIFYEYDKQNTHASLLIRVFEGDDKEPCLVPRMYTITYHDDFTDVEIHNSDVDTNEILEFLDSLYFILSPLKQSKLGIPIDEISCGESLILMTKHDGSPAYVSQFTAPKLADRGWVWVLDLGFWKDSPLLIPPTKYVIKTDNGTYAGQYMMPSASVDSISYDESSNSLILLMNSNERGILHMELPNGLLYPIKDAPFSYTVSVNGETTEHGEFSPMILKISFEKGTERIEIVGTYIP